MKRAVYWAVLICLLLAACEGLARLSFSIEPVASRLNNFKDSYTWQRLWVERYRHGREIYYPFDRYDALKGWVPAPNLHNQVVFGGKILNTNAEGLRGTRSFATDKTRPRILLLGNSYTFGDEVSDDETYAHFLQVRLPDYDVINMGVHGYGHDQMLLYFETKGVRYRPDVVIVGFLGIDMERNMLSFRDFAKPRFVLGRGPQDLRLTHVPVPRPETVLARDRWRPRLVDLGALLYVKIRKVTGAFDRDTEEVTRRLLRRIVHTANRIGARPILVYLPWGREITSPAATTAAEQFLHAFCQTESDVSCFSVRPAFKRKIAAGATFEMQRHWGPLGHRTAAEAIAHDLQSPRRR